MVKYMCTVCGFIHEGDSAPDFCPQCKAPRVKFRETDRQNLALPDEHRVGIAQGLENDILEALRMEFIGECTEVGIYLAISRQADREGYPEVAGTLRRIAFEEADHAARYAELLGEMVTGETKKNLEKRAEAEYRSCESKKKLATKAKQLNLDAIHDAVHEMCKDEARHYGAFGGLLRRYFS